MGKGRFTPRHFKLRCTSKLFDVSLNDLVRHDPEVEGLPIPPRNKHIFGVVTLGERGQVVLPKKARETFNLQPGDSLVVLGDTTPATRGLALIESATFMQMTGAAVEQVFQQKGE